MEYRHLLWGSENYNFYYLPILKNAQTWGKYFFTKNFDFKYLGDKPITIKINEKKVIVFYRNPLSRWFSGAAQWFAKQVIDGQGLPKDYKIENLMLELIFSAGKLDDHTKLQREAFANIGYQKCIFFDVEDKNFIKNLINYLETVRKVEVKYKDLPKINIVEENDLKVNIKKQLLLAYKNNENFSKNLLQYLKFDFDEYQWLKDNKMFYSTNNSYYIESVT